MQPSMQNGMNHIASRAEPLIRKIPLRRLELAPENVRKTPPDPQADAEFKASIAALTVADRRSDRVLPFQAFVDRHQARSVPVVRLEPVHPFRPDVEDRSRKRILVQHAFQHRSKAVQALPEILGLRRDDDPHPVRREDHAGAFSAKTISAIRPGGVSALRRIVTRSRITSRRSPPDAGARRSPCHRTTGAKSTSPCNAGKTRRPFRA